ncbi:TPA: YheC/YheD family protein [Bacillus thuringiensis]|nr:YheC/YheD family protein [Bacillus thuringiensis]
MVQSPNKVLRFSKEQELMEYLQKHIRLENYKIQQYISWATIENQYFDVKVILHRKRGQFTWKVTERFVEVLDQVLSIERAITCSNLKEVDTEQLLKDIDALALQIAQKSDSLFPHHRSFGLDIRLDRSGKMQVIQAYSRPVKVKGNKLKIYDLFKDDHYLSSLIPETKEIKNEYTLFSFLNQYRHVVLKPISGSLGRGIMKLIVDNQYTLQYMNKTFQFVDKSQLITFLKQKIKSKRYIVQRYIELATVNDSPFDFRVIVQQNSKDYIWKVTGVYAKVAFDGYFTTNLAKKGTAMTVHHAISNSNIKESSIQELLERIDVAGLRVAQRLKEIAPYHRIFGIDMGIDSSGALWIIEVNSKPGIKGFKKLKDQSMYHTIRKYKK